MIVEEFKCDPYEDFSVRERRKAMNSLEASVSQSINRYIKTTGLFPMVDIAVSYDYKKFGVGVTGERYIKS